LTGRVPQFERTYRKKVVIHEAHTSRLHGHQLTLSHTRDIDLMRTTASSTYNLRMAGVLLLSPESHWHFAVVRQLQERKAIAHIACLAVAAGMLRPYVPTPPRFTMVTLTWGLRTHAKNSAH
jgi:hypothetical protein